MVADLSRHSLRALIMKTPEYTEGPEAAENLEQFARAILQAPKPKIKPKKRVPKDATLREPKIDDRD